MNVRYKNVVRHELVEDVLVLVCDLREPDIDCRIEGRREKQNQHGLWLDLQSALNRGMLGVQVDANTIAGYRLP